MMTRRATVPFRTGSLLVAFSTGALLGLGGCFSLASDGDTAASDAGTNPTTDGSAPGDADANPAADSPFDSGAPDDAGDSPDTAPAPWPSDLYVVPGAVPGVSVFPSIALALAAPASRPTRIHVAAGTYGTGTGESFPITLPPGVSLLGAGVGATIIQGAGASFDQVGIGTFASTTSAVIVSWSPLASATTISGITFQPDPNLADAGDVIDAGDAASDAGNADGGAATKAVAEAIQCKGGSAQAPGDAGAVLANLNLSAVKIEGFDIGVHLGLDSSGSGCNAVITSSTFASGKIGVLASGSSTRYVLFQIGDNVGGGNTFDGLHDSDADDLQYNGTGVRTTGATGGSLLHNSFTNSDIGAWLDQDGAAVPVTFPAVDNNTFGHLFNNGLTLERGIVVGELSNNTFSSISTQSYPGGGETWLGIGVIVDAMQTTFPIVQRARGNVFFGNDAGLVIRGVGVMTAMSDFGTPSEAGGNTFRCNSSPVDQRDGLGGDVILSATLSAPSVSTPVPLAGNIWDHAPPTTFDQPGYTDQGVDLAFTTTFQGDLTNATTTASPACPAGAVP